MSNSQGANAGFSGDGREANLDPQRLVGLLENLVPLLMPWEKEAWDRGELIVRGDVEEGKRMYLAFHPEQYVRNVFADGLAVVDYEPEGARGNPRQDLYVLRRPLEA